MSITTAEPLIEVAAKHRLLEPSKIDELRKVLRGRQIDPQTLANELTKRGWFTPFQIKFLLQGNGHQLVIGPYVLQDRLGDGGTGQVFKALHQHMKRQVALKIIRKELLVDQEVVERFYQEIETTSQVSHPYVVHAYDAGPIGSNHVLAMEFVEGVDLGKLVEETGPLSVNQACTYIAQAAIGLQHIHERGLIHRDMKPQNLVVTPHPRDLDTGYGQIKILDLGLARLYQPTAGSRNLTQLSGDSVMMGTPDYMAPEQAIDFHRVDIRADIYGLGCVFWFLLTAKSPFAGATLAEKLMRHQQGDLPPLEEIRPGLPDALDPILQRMMAKRAADRYATPGEVSKALIGISKEVRVHQVPGRKRTTQANDRPTKHTKQESSGSTIKAFGWLRSVFMGIFAMLGWMFRLAVQSTKTEGPFFRSKRFKVGAGVLLLLCVSIGLYQLGVFSGAASPGSGANGTETIPEDERLSWHPAELAAVLGIENGRQWDNVYALAVSPDGRQILSGGSTSTIFKWDANTLRSSGTITGNAWGTAQLAYSPQGKLVFFASRTRNNRSEVKSIDQNTGRAHQLFRGFNGIVSGLGVSPDGRSLVAWGRKYESNKSTSQGMAWDAASGKVLHTFAPTGSIMATVIGADGRALAAGYNKVTRLWDMATGKEIALVGAVSSPRKAAFSRDGRLLAMHVYPASKKYEIKIWDTRTGALTRTIALPGYGSQLAFSPKGDALACAYRETVAGKSVTMLSIWSLAAGGLKSTAKPQASTHTTSLSSMAFAPNGKQVVIGTSKGQIQTWDTSTGVLVPPEQSYRATGLAFTGDGKTLISIGDRPESAVKFWDLNTRTERKAISFDTSTPRPPILQGGNTLAVPYGNGIKIWNLANDQEIPISGTPASISLAALGDQGHNLALMYRRYTGKTHVSEVTLWDARSGKKIKAKNESGSYTRMAFAPGGKMLACAGLRYEGTVRKNYQVVLWDIDGGSTRTIELPSNPYGIVFAPRSPLMAASLYTSKTGKRYTIQIWDATTGKPVSTLDGHVSTATGIQINATGQSLASWGSGELILWNLGQKKEIRRFTGNYSGLENVAFSPDGQKLAAVNREGKITLCESTSGGVIKEWQMPGRVAALAFSPDGHRLATANGNGSIYILRTP